MATNKDFKIKNGLITGSHIIPNTDGSIDLGVTGTNKFRDIFLKGKIDLQSGSGSNHALFFFNNSVKNGWLGIPSWDNTSFKIYVPGRTTGNTNEPGLSYKDGAWSFFTDFNNTTGNGSTSPALFISTGGSLNVGRGDYQINGTTVINSARDFTAYNKLTFSYNSHYLQAGTNSIAFKNSSGTSYFVSNNSTFTVNTDLNLSSGDLQIGGSNAITSDKDAYLRQAFLQHSTPNVKLIDSDTTNKQGVVKFNDGVLTLQSKNNTSNGTIKFEGDNGTTVTEYGRFDAYGRFGIGSTPSNYALEVYDDANILLKLASTTSTNNVRMAFSPHNTSRWNIGVQASNYDFTFYDSTNGATPFRIEQGASENTLMVDVNSRVGMGLNNPATRVHIKDDSSPVLRVEDGTNNVKTDIGATDTQGYIGTQTAHPFMIRHSNTDSYRFDNFKQMYHGNTTDAERLMTGGNLTPYQYLDTRDYMRRKGHHASSGYVVFLNNSGHRVTPYMDNTNIYINGTLHISNASAYEIQEIQSSDLSTYDVITADKPIVVAPNQPRNFCSPISFGGHILAGFSTRYYPIIFRLFAPYSKVDVEIYKNSSNTVDISGTPSYTGTIEAGGGLAITESGASGTNYWIIKATGYIVGMQSPTGGDNILLPPIGQEVLSNAQATSVIKINDGTNSSATTMTNNNGAYYYRENRGDRELGIGAFGTADGAGGDAEFGVPLEFLSDYYIYPQSDITNFRLASYTANKIQVLDKDGNRLYTIDHSNATKEVPQLHEEGSSSGNGSALNSNGAFRFIGTAPFHLVCQSTSDYECVQLGALQSELDNVQAFQGGYIDNPITIKADNNAILMETASNPSSYYAYISSNYNYTQSFSIKAKGGGNEYTIMDWGDGQGLEFHGGSTQNIKFSNHDLSSIDTISSAYLNTSSNINSTGVKGITVADGRLGFDQSGTRSWTMGVGTGYLNVYSGDGNGDFNLANNIGLRQNGTLVLDSSRNLSNLGTITCGNITTSGFVQSNNSTGFTANSSSVILKAIAPGVESGHTTKHEMTYGWSGTHDRTYNAPKIDGTPNFNHEFGYDFANENWYFEDLLSIGSISSGAVTCGSIHTSGGLTFASGDHFLGEEGGAGQSEDLVLRTGAETNDQAIKIQAGYGQPGDSSGQILMYTDGNTTAYRLRINADGDVDINVGALSFGGFSVITSARNMQNIGNINIGGYYAMDGVTIIDTSKNIVNVGTISSGAITTSGDINIDSTSAIHMDFGQGVTSDVIAGTGTTVKFGGISTSDDITAQLVAFGENGIFEVSDGETTIQGSHGELLNFKTSSTTTEGSIGSRSESSYNLFMETSSGTGAVGFKISTAFGSHYISPSQDQGATADNMLRLGFSSNRYKELYAVDGSINTSDINEKQDIQELTEAEQRVALACKGLIRRYKWNHAVEEKGEDARYHIGIMAQDLQQAFTDEGLDASKYGLFTSDTWENEDGTEETRLGVRYNELLAFIISAI